MLKAGVNRKAIYWLGIMVLMQMSHSCFKQSKTSLLIPHINILGVFCKFFGEFWVYLGINSFSQGIEDIWKI